MKHILSPHLSIYKPQITSVSSILGRICGVVSFIFMVAMAWLFIYSSYFGNGNPVFFKVISVTVGSDSSFVRFLSAFFIAGIIFTISFYTMSLIKHLAWDFKVVSSVKVMEYMSYGFILFSLIFAIAATKMIFFIMSL